MHRRAGRTTKTEGTTRASIAGYDAILSAFSVDPDDAPFPVFQTEAALLVPTRNDARFDLVQMHGTCPAASAPQYGATFRSIMQSLAVATE